jgi:hypothetical protein
MNNHMILRSPAIASAAASDYYTFCNDLHRHSFASEAEKALAAQLDFKRITPDNMQLVWSFLQRESGRTTDFSYGGTLMWVDYFHYEFAILNDTLFIKGRVESDVSKVAFSLPVGKMPLSMSVAILKDYCIAEGIPLIFSAVPEYAIDEFRDLQPSSVEELPDWADYLYSAASLSTLSGKKYGKKRNHVNQFLAAYPDYTFSPMTPDDVPEALQFMDAIDAEGDDTPMATTERQLNREMLGYMADADPVLSGGVLRDAQGNLLAFTIGDIKGDTLFIHIEKALRDVPGGFEMINKSFAAYMCGLHPEIQYINREDDAGDPGLRYAKESYHPVEMLRKFNVAF